ncbi:MAG: SHOCT domain-containing protein [Mariniphaga sp.]
MEDLYNDGSIVVTMSTIKYRAQSYPIRTIDKISDFKMEPEIKNFIINLVVGIAGIYGIFTFKTVWVIIGLIALGIGGYNCYDIITRAHYMVIVEFSNGEKFEFDFPEEETAIILRDAINKAMGNGEDMESVNKDSKTTPKFEDKVKLGNNELVLLNELKDKGLLTTEEYNNKIKTIEDNKLKSEFNSKLKNITDPLLKPLIESREKGLLTEEEFNSKRSEIIAKHQKLLNEEILIKQNFLSEIPENILAKLSSAKKYKLEGLIENMEASDLIVFHDNTVKLIKIKDWENIVSSGENGKFEIICRYKNT